MTRTLPEHRAASAWAGKGVEALGRRAGTARSTTGPGRDLTFSAPTPPPEFEQMYYQQQQSGL